MKRSELLFNVISIFVDWLMLLLAGLTAFYLRFHLSPLRPVLYQLTWSQYFQVLFEASPLIILILALAGLYNLKGTRRVSAELLKILLAVSSGLLVIIVLFFFNQSVFPSRLIVLMAWGLAIVFISFGRLILRQMQVRMLRRGIGLHRLVVIYPADKPHELMDTIGKRPELGFKIVGSLQADLPIAELLSSLEQLRVQKGIDELLQADPMLDPAASGEILKFCRDFGIKFNFVPNFFETATGNVAVETISGTPVIVLKNTPLEGWGRVIKRLVDITAAAAGLITLSPVYLLVAIAIKLDSRGPVFFHQARAAGLGQFEFYKFRSMHYEMSEGTAAGDKLREQLEKQNARLGPYVKIKNDPRVTRIGRIIRKTKLDELPSLWHILRGQMSLVGPRVHMTKEVDHFRNEYKHLFVIKPGATGLTQIIQASDNPEISWEEEIKLDAFYIENWSLWLDLYIIFKTILILLGKRPKVDY